MKITDVKATAMRPVLVQVYTDEGIMGIGECSPMNSKVIAHFVNTALKPLLVHENPLEIGKLWNKMTFSTYKLGVQGVQPEAIAGVDIALWDILGKVTGLPICMLLGGCYREKVLMYASIGGGYYATENVLVQIEFRYMEQLDVFEGESQYPFDLTIMSFSFGVGYRF